MRNRDHFTTHFALIFFQKGPQGPGILAVLSTERSHSIRLTSSFLKQHNPMQIAIARRRRPLVGREGSEKARLVKFLCCFHHVMPNCAQFAVWKASGVCAIQNAKDLFEQGAVLTGLHVSIPTSANLCLQHFEITSCDTRQDTEKLSMICHRKKVQRTA